MTHPSRHPRAWWRRGAPQEADVAARPHPFEAVEGRPHACRVCWGGPDVWQHHAEPEEPTP